jgi:catechol 2,3-dioxygenase-like lactoylglutathione lyase family enzyme
MSLNIIAIAGFAVITEDVAASRALYQDRFGLPFKVKDGYHYVDGFDGAKHFGIWPLAAAAQSCFGMTEWPEHIPRPQTTIEYELEHIESVQAAVRELKAAGQEFVHEARLEPWGQTIARFISPEGVLVGLSFAPWLHPKQSSEVKQ